MSFDKNTKDYIDYRSALSSASNYGCANPNPNFGLTDFDYELYLNGNTRKLVTDITNNTKASLYVKGAGGKLIGTTSFPAVSGMEYRAVVEMRGLYDGKPVSDKQVSYYAGVACHDGDDLHMAPPYFPKDNTKIGILTKELKAGDTSCTYTIDGDQPFNVKSNGYYNQVLGWRKQDDGTYRYIGKNGKLYSNKGYSRYIGYGSSNGFFDQDPVDNGDGTYTLNFKKAWYGDTLEIGSAVTQSVAGGNYAYYIPNQKITLDGEWHKTSSAWLKYNGDDPNYGGGFNKLPFRQDTVSAKLLILPNYRCYDGGDLSKVESWYSSLRIEYRYPTD